MDLGRVRIQMGANELGHRPVRRKVLALLCFLLTRTRFEATREEVIEALWPDIDPPAAVNSLNQSVYFLRRVFEPDYHEETTAGYLHQDSDLVWLDRALVDSESQRCARLIEAFERTRDMEMAHELSALVQRALCFGLCLRGLGFELSRVASGLVSQSHRAAGTRAPRRWSLRARTSPGATGCRSRSRERRSGTLAAQTPSKFRGTLCSGRAVQPLRRPPPPRPWNRAATTGFLVKIGRMTY